MPAASLEDTVKAAVQRNREIPAMLDAYGEFVDSQIGPLELASLDTVFALILDNLMQRFPEVASKRASTAARNDVLSFLVLANNDPDRVRAALRRELHSVSQAMAVSISERFSRLNSEERGAIDATLRLIRRSTTELLFRVEAGSQLSKAGREYDRFFASIRAQAPALRDLRYQNLVVEKAIFNKLLLKSKDRDYSIWVPSLYAKENVDLLLDRAAFPNAHVLLTHLGDVKSRGKLEELRPFLTTLVENLGVLTPPTEVPEELKDYVKVQGTYAILAPMELDDIVQFLGKEEEERRAREKEEQERERARLEEERRREEERKAEQARLRRRPATLPGATVQQQPMVVTQQEGGIFLGKRLDSEQFLSAIGRRVQERELPSQVKTVGDYVLDPAAVKSLGVTIVGSSGSGRSTTLRRLLDGLGTGAARVVVIDQKGEHRGIAWKYGWKVFGFAADSQAQAFRVDMFPLGNMDSELVADLLQEWCLQAGLSCSDQQRARFSAVVKAEQSGTGTDMLERIVSKLAAEAETAALGQKLQKNLLGKGNSARILGAAREATLDGNVLLDISGRGLRDPTTREERQLLSVLLLNELLRKGNAGCIVVLEDVLDRFKSESLKRRTTEIVGKLKGAGNSFVVTTRGQVREFMGQDSIEILHRLSGEKAISEVLQGFRTDLRTHNLPNIVAFLPRGYALTSKFAGASSAAIHAEPLMFGSPTQ